MMEEELSCHNSDSTEVTKAEFHKLSQSHAAGMELSQAVRSSDSVMDSSSMDMNKDMSGLV